MKYRIFISSVQKEFGVERQAIAEHIENDPVLGRFFEVFLFERLPARHRSAEETYLDELKKSDLYLGLFGYEYGWEDANGLSPTHKEYACATEMKLPRLIFVHKTEDKQRHPKMDSLIKQAESEVVRKSFFDTDGLVSAISASLADFLDDKKAFRHIPFDADVCRSATLKDISRRKINQFIDLAQEARALPVTKRMSIAQILTHLNMLKEDLPTHAALLLFGKDPQRFLLNSEIRCAHFHGTEVEKPIPFYRVFRGTLFEMIDNAIDFVLSKINFSVGTRRLSTRVPTAYEIPLGVIREAIVNAVAHRDYTENGSVQVMLFADRLEIRNPGRLQRPLTLADLEKPHSSFPTNELLAKGLYYAQYIEQMGTGIEDMFRQCRKVGLKPPQFALNDGFTLTIFRDPEAAFRLVKIASGEIPQPEDSSQNDDSLINQLLKRLKNEPEEKARLYLQALMNAIAHNAN